MNVLINGISSNSAGGKTVITNLLNEISKEDNLQNKYFVVCTETMVKNLNYTNIELIVFPDYFSTPKYLLFYYFFRLHYTILKLKIDVLLNLADVLIPTVCKQIYYFDWAYAVYPESIVWRKMDYKGYVKRKFKVLIIKLFISRVDKVIVQTSVIESRIKSIFKIENVVTAPNSFSFEYLISGEFKDFNFPKKNYNFLYLTKYYDHKNFEIILEFANRINENGSNFSIIITIEEADSTRAKQFLELIKKSNLSCVINIGNVEIRYLGALYKQIDCLLMPSHLESFSGTYLEAIHSNKAILASDYDFSRVVCESYATYFDAFSAEDLFQKASELMANDKQNYQIRKLILEKYEKLNPAKIIIECLK
jgi:glycosyltransferase involved in cell wall biosynthesis